MHLRLDHAGCRISTLFAFIRTALGIVTIFLLSETFPTFHVVHICWFEWGEFSPNLKRIQPRQFASFVK